MTPALIIAAIEAGMQLINLASKVAEGMKQSGELSPEAEAKLDAKIKALTSQPWWTPE
jgi:hypothetical protein